MKKIRRKDELYLTCSSFFSPVCQLLCNLPRSLLDCKVVAWIVLSSYFKACSKPNCVFWVWLHGILRLLQNPMKCSARSKVCWLLGWAAPALNWFYAVCPIIWVVTILVSRWWSCSCIYQMASSAFFMCPQCLPKFPSSSQRRANCVGSLDFLSLSIPHGS